MRKRILCVAALAALPALAGAQCVGFADTADDVFCPAVEWLKNRSITTGCDLAGTNYCPGSPVSRLAMAQFMQRLGKALTPVVLFAEQPLGNQAVAASNGGTMLCITAPYTPAFAQTARFAGQVFGHPNAGPAWLQGRFKYTTDDGATWQFVGGAGAMMGRDWADYAQVAGFAVFGTPMALTPQTTYRFGVGVDGAGVSYTFNPLICQVQVTIDNANPATSPLDD